MMDKQKSKSRRKPNLFIVGAPKCGTGSLYFYLQEHPQVFMSTPKEPRYFCKDLLRERKEFERHLSYFQKKKSNYFHFYTKDEYLDLFKEGKDKKVLGEKTPYYLYSKVAAKEIYNFNPRAKIIIMLRNPIDFAYSLHSHHIFRVEPEGDFEKAIALETSRKKGKLPQTIAVPSLLYYSELVKWAEQIKKYLKYFPKSQIKVIIFDEFIKDTRKVYVGILKFLELDDFTPDLRPHNQNRRMKYPGLIKIFSLSSISTFFKMISPKSYIKITRFFSRFFFTVDKRKPLRNGFKIRLMKQYKNEVINVNEILHKSGLIKKGLDLVKLWGYD